MNARIAEFRKAIENARLVSETGRVLECNGLLLEATGPDVFLGELCEVSAQNSDVTVLCEVVGFREGRTLLMPYGNIHGLSRESKVVTTGRAFNIPVGASLLGRVVDAFCEPLDDRGPIELHEQAIKLREPINPLNRKPITEILETGVRAVDSLLSIGKGQRMGIFAGSGVGKSTLLGMMARNMPADVNVIALIGERGREVWDFIRHSLGEEGLSRSVVIVATADQPALVRTHAAWTATAIAEYFRDQRKDVLLIMDSVTRFAMAQREIGLAMGEPPTSRGYTPSVFGLLPQLLERCGNFSQGSITAVYNVLVEGDDMNEPVADHMRAILDGHIVLSREIASRGHYPAIDITHSISRLMPALVSEQENSIAMRTVELVSRVENARDLIDMGAYHAGSNVELDLALARIDAINEFLVQKSTEAESRKNAIQRLQKIFEENRNGTVFRDTHP